MQAWVQRQKGNPQHNLTLESAWTKPKTQANDVLLRVNHAALNPVGYKLLQYGPNFVVKRPCVPEADCSGVVVSAPADSGFVEGDKVFGSVTADVVQKTGQGALAEFTAVDAAQLVKRPESFDSAQAAACGIAAVTAYTFLQNANMLEGKGRGKKVFVNGASGGVGTFVVQMAKAEGIKVCTTCSERSRSLVESLGADDIVDYRQHKIEEHLAKNYSKKDGKALDAVFDTIGTQSIYTASPKFMKSGAPYLSVGADIHSLGSAVSYATSMAANLYLPSFLGGTSTPFKFFLVKPADFKAGLEYTVNLVQQGKLKVIVDQVYDFADVPASYTKMMSGRAQGKIVVKVAS